jgi:hypothetical protein
MFVYTTLGSTGVRLGEKKIFKKFANKKVTMSLYLTYAWGRPHVIDSNESLHIS